MPILLVLIAIFVFAVNIIFSPFAALLFVFLMGAFLWERNVNTSAYIGKSSYFAALFWLSTVVSHRIFYPNLFTGVWGRWYILLGVSFFVFYTGTFVKILYRNGKNDRFFGDTLRQISPH